MAVARQNGWWTIYEPVEALAEPPESPPRWTLPRRHASDGTGSPRARRRPCCGGSSVRRRTTPGSGGSSRSSPRPSPANEPRDDYSTDEDRGPCVTFPRRPLQTPAIAPCVSCVRKGGDVTGSVSTNVTADAAASAPIARLGPVGSAGHPPDRSDGSGPEQGRGRQRRLPRPRMGSARSSPIAGRLGTRRAGRLPAARHSRPGDAIVACPSKGRPTWRLNRHHRSIDHRSALSSVIGRPEG